jgi:YHS domain-containing protein
MKHVIFLASLAFANLAACGGAPNTPATQAAGPKPMGEAKVGDKTACPISGEEFVITDQSPKVAYEGKTYYFCCSGCDKKFQENPQKYLKKT